MVFKKRASKAFALALTTALLATPGCTSDDLAKAAGHYEGFRVFDGPSGPAQSSVGGDLSIADGSKLEISVADEPASGAPTTFEATISAQSIALSSPSGFLPKTLTLAAGSAGCYADTAGDQLCYDGSTLEVLVVTAAASGSVPASTAKFVLDRMNPGAGSTPPAAAVAPRAYSVDELIALAQTRNFDTQVEFDNVVQAKLNAQESYLDLLPHINIGSGLDLLGFVPTTMIRAIGDLLPFFLPDRWFQAAAAEHAAAAEFDSYRVVQASGMNIVQGLAYSVLRDEQALLAMEQNRVEITEVRDEVLAAEQNGSGSLQVGSADEVTAVINSLVSGIDAMEETIAQEKIALSQAAGFPNPDAVSGVEPITVPAITGPLPGSAAQFGQDAVNRSLDLLQLDDLAEEAKQIKNGAFFQWLDPAGNDQGSLGFGLIDSIKIDSSAIQQLYDRKADTQSTLLETVNDAFGSSDQLAEQYALAQQAAQLAQTQVDRLLLDFRNGIPFGMSDLVSALQNRTQADIGQINDQYAYLIIEAQMDYLTYSGPYAALLSEQWNGSAVTPAPAPAASATPAPAPTPAP